MMECPDVTEEPAEQDMFSTPTTAARPIGRHKAKRRQDGSSEIMWPQILEEMQRKNELLERHTLALEKATELQLLTTPLNQLDELSRMVIEKQKREVAMKYFDVEQFIEEV